MVTLTALGIGAGLVGAGAALGANDKHHRHHREHRHEHHCHHKHTDILYDAVKDLMENCSTDGFDPNNPTKEFSDKLEFLFDAFLIEKVKRSDATHEESIKIREYLAKKAEEAEAVQKAEEAPNNDNDQPIECMQGEIVNAAPPQNFYNQQVPPAAPPVMDTVMNPVVNQVSPAAAKASRSRKKKRKSGRFLTL